MRRVLLVTSILVAVTGCARYWAKPGATVAETAATEDSCETDAITRFPLVPAYSVSMSGTNATTYVGTTYFGAELDMNGRYRNVAFRSCMINAGWLPARQEFGAAAMSQLRRIVEPPPEVIVREARAWCDRMFFERKNAGLMAAFHNSVDQCVLTRSHDID